MFAAEATLLRSQHFGLGRRGSDPQHVTATEEILMVGYSHHWEIFGEPWLRVQRLDGEPPWGLWVGLVASPGSLSRHLSCSSLSPVFDLVDWGFPRVVLSIGR
jgi:hypothetical protein